MAIFSRAYLENVGAKKGEIFTKIFKQDASLASFAKYLAPITHFCSPLFTCLSNQVCFNYLCILALCLTQSSICLSESINK